MDEKLQKLNTIRPDNSIEKKEKIKLRILVADDDSKNSDIIKEVLEAEGHNVVVVSSGQLLLDKLLDPKESWDLIITDKNMPLDKNTPGKSGLEVIKKVRSNERLKNIRIVLVTTDVSRELINELKELKVVHLPKPLFHLEKLLSAVDESGKLVESVK